MRGRTATPRPGLRLARLSLLGLLLCPGVGRAQEPPPPPSEPQGFFAESINARTVNVEVYVTDRDGEPVTGLTKDDFTLLVDGRPVVISNFYSAEEGVPSVPQAPPREPVEPAPGAAETPPAPPRLGDRTEAAPPVDQQLWMVLYVDNRHIEPLHRNRIFGQLLGFLGEEVERGDKVMLVSYDGGLRIEQTFGDDVGSLSRRLLDLAGRSGAPSGSAGDRRDVLRAIEQAGSSAEVTGRAIQEARSLRGEMRETLRALRDSVQTLAGLPGRKAIVYVSDGLPLVPGRDLFYAIQNRFSDRSALTYSMEFDLAREFQELAQNANASHVSFLTVDATGLDLDDAYKAESGGGAYDNDLRSTVASVHRANREAAIEMMAAQTGGVAILGTNDIRPRLTRAVRSLRTYYSLGFQPTGPGDSRYHAFDVRVARNGVRVRHREGYRDKSPATRMAEKVEASLRFDIEEDPMGIRLDLGRPLSREGSDELVLPVTVRIPIGRVTLVPQGGIYHGKLMLFFSALDPDGNVAQVGSEPLDLEIPAADYAEAVQKVWTYEGRLLVREGRQRVAVAVRDELSGEEAFLGRTVSLDGG